MLGCPSIASRIQMLLTYARAFAVTAASLEFSRGQANVLMMSGDNRLINSNEGIGPGAKSALEATRSLCSDIPSLNLVVHQINRLLVKLDSSILPAILYNDLENLQHRMFEELQNHYYYPVTSHYTAMYANEKPFGEQVYLAFPSARLDIKNAVKCGVLGQSTAAVFHLMRVMEVGLKVLGREADIPYAPSWESYLAQFNKKFIIKHSEKTNAWRRKEPVMRELCGDILAIKTAWRNPTMHVAREYSVEEALQVYTAVSIFMEHLAAKFREKGKPIAAGLLGYASAE
ncbi:MAG: hypothetical protein JWO15_3138 [Sphingomonadales bacterium]|nr:hypothetical protein [Sphingomonadales bacterium]